MDLKAGELYKDRINRALHTFGGDEGFVDEMYEIILRQTSWTIKLLLLFQI